MTEYPEVEFYNENGSAAVTYELKPICPDCCDVFETCDECGKPWKYGDKMVCHGWKSVSEDGTDYDGDRRYRTGFGHPVPEARPFQVLQLRWLHSGATLRALKCLRLKPYALLPYLKVRVSARRTLYEYYD